MIHHNLARWMDMLVSDLQSCTILSGQQQRMCRNIDLLTRDSIWRRSNFQQWVFFLVYTRERLIVQRTRLSKLNNMRETIYLFIYLFIWLFACFLCLYVESNIMKYQLNHDHVHVRNMHQWVRSRHMCVMICWLDTYN